MKCSDGEDVLSDTPISIKGLRDGLYIAMSGNGAWADAERSLLAQIETRTDFFRGARVALDVGELTLDREDIKKLRDRLAQHDVTLWAVLGKDAETLRSARREDLETELPEAPPLDEEAAPESLDDGELRPIDSSEPGSAGVLVRNTLRSGRTVKHTGHVVVIGDVNPGAQIIAGGDVLVWGRLRGTVHAGALGDPSALVCALDMRPMQLRIASFVATAPAENQPRPRPEVAFIRDNQIVAEEWGS